MEQTMQIEQPKQFKESKQPKRSLTIPIGKGGVPGRLFRFTLMLLSGGFIYPNVAVEGMNLTEIQAGYEGSLYKNVKKSVR